MRRIDSNDALRVWFHANEGAGLGAVSMQDVRLQSSDQRMKRPHTRASRGGVPVDGEAMDAEAEARRDLASAAFGAFAR